MIRGCHYLCKYMEDKKAAKKWSSTDPAKDLEIDPAFGIPALLPASTPPVNPDALAMVEMQRQQQMAALQVGMSNLGGINPALLNQGAATPISTFLSTASDGKEKDKKKGAVSEV